MFRAVFTPSVFAFAFAGCLLPRIGRREEPSDGVSILDAADLDVPQSRDAEPADAVVTDASDAQVCATGEIRCGAACINPMSSTAHCGACGVNCNRSVGEQNTCVNGVCGASMTCRNGYRRVGADCIPSQCGGPGSVCLDGIQCPAASCPIAVHAIRDADLAATGTTCDRARAFDPAQMDVCARAAVSTCRGRGYATGWGPIRLETVPENQIQFICVSASAIRSMPRIATSASGDCQATDPYSAGCMDRIIQVCERAGHTGMGPISFFQGSAEVEGICLSQTMFRAVTRPTVPVVPDCVGMGARRSVNCQQWTHGQCQSTIPFALTGLRTVQNPGGSQADWGYECLFNP